MDDEYVVEEFSDDDYVSSSSEDELQNFIKRECGLQEVEDDFETEVDKVMSAHLKKIKSTKENCDDDNITTEPGTSQNNSSKTQTEINDELLYDPDMDDDDEKWIDAKRRSYIFPTEKTESGKGSLKPLPNSDAVLNCPACLSLLCLDCQRHDIYKGQYRAMFVNNCKVITDEILKYPIKKKRSKKHSENVDTTKEDVYNPVKCAVCNTEVAVYDADEIYHFFNVLASY